MAEVISAISNSLVQILTVISTFIVSGGLAAVVKYRKDKKEAQLDRDELRNKQVEHEKEILAQTKEIAKQREEISTQKIEIKKQREEISTQNKEISELKKYICYRKQCPNRLKVYNKSKRKKTTNEEFQNNTDNKCGE